MSHLLDLSTRKWLEDLKIELITLQRKRRLMKEKFHIIMLEIASLSLRNERGLKGVKLEEAVFQGK